MRRACSWLPELKVGMRRATSRGGLAIGEDVDDVVEEGASATFQMLALWSRQNVKHQVCAIIETLVVATGLVVAASGGCVEVKEGDENAGMVTSLSK